MGEADLYFRGPSGNGSSKNSNLPVSEENPLPVTGGGITYGVDYQAVAASQTDEVLGAAGAVGDYLSGLLVVPENLNPGAIAILDDSTSITVFEGGTGSVVSLVPFFIPIQAKSVNGAWKVTTGADVSVVASGQFT